MRGRLWAVMIPPSRRMAMSGAICSKVGAVSVWGVVVLGVCMRVSYSSTVSPLKMVTHPISVMWSWGP